MFFMKYLIFVYAHPSKMWKQGRLKVLLYICSASQRTSGITSDLASILPKRRFFLNKNNPTVPIIFGFQIFNLQKVTSCHNNIYNICWFITNNANDLFHLTLTNQILKMNWCPKIYRFKRLNNKFTAVCIHGQVPQLPLSKDFLRRCKSK